MYIFYVAFNCLFKLYCFALAWLNFDMPEETFDTKSESLGISENNKGTHKAENTEVGLW